MRAGFDVWRQRSIEIRLRDKLEGHYGLEKGQECNANYISARRALVENILPEIKAMEPTLTDHSADHVANVLDNVEKVLGEDIEKLTPLELYILSVSVLFHDVGNLHGREKHNRNISSIYDFARNKDASFGREKSIVLKIAGAHSGKASDGTSDTLKEVPLEMQLDGEKIRAQYLAAVLRLADELAEGCQRTSVYMLSEHKYDQNSKIYHAYASITDVCIDRPQGRIALSYLFQTITTGAGLVVMSSELSVPLQDMLAFTYKRVSKLDEERKYTKYYCDWLAPFKAVSVRMDFWVGGNHVEVGINPVVLGDLVVPGESRQKDIGERDAAYAIDTIVGRIVAAGQKG